MRTCWSFFAFYLIFQGRLASQTIKTWFSISVIERKCVKVEQGKRRGQERRSQNKMKTFRFFCGHNKNRNADIKQPELNRQEGVTAGRHYSKSYFHCRSRQDHNPGIILIGKYRAGGSQLDCETIKEVLMVLIMMMKDLMVMMSKLILIVIQ